ncbi:MAG TPA: maleylpyruvate isomerase N-terminal domain-containing protein [Streptosporangiaceae bacterium]|nr:maleylpyruvate isomerase N-terminal domain-containing protein [Streptosporangiaceae bacterium]
MESNPRVWIAALRQSHDRLLSLVGPLSPEQVSGPSYCKDWSIAQVLSHLGSGAEIAMMMLPSALGQAEPVDRSAFGQIWDRWNAMSPDDQAAAGLVADAQHIQMLDQLSDEDLASISYPFMGVTLDAVGLIRLRLGEHALHTWDVAVMHDPVAEVAPDATNLLIDAVATFLAPRLGKPADPPFRARIRTTEPARDYLLSASDSVSMVDWPGADQAGADGAAIAEVTMPAEALLRLSYGRLDPDHTPASVTADPADLDRLRAIFPGF